MNVFELFGTIAIKNRDANAAIQDTTQRAERASSKISAAFKKIGETSIKIAKPIIAGATAAATAIAATVEKTRDYRTAMAQLDTAFVTNGFTAKTAYDTYKKFFALLGDTDQSVEAVTALALMCKKEEDLAKWTEICTGVFSVMQGKLPIEGLTEAANETAKVGVVTGNLADALNWAGISEDDFNLKLKACTSEEARQELIMNTLYWTYKVAADQYKETGESVMKANEAQEKLNKAIGTLGHIAEPIVTGVKSWIADMVTASIPHLENMIAKFKETDSVWGSFIWPLIQGAYKITMGIEYPDWETFKANLKSDWEYVKAEAEKNIVIKALIDIPKNYATIAQKIKDGWETVKTYIKDTYKTIFGVDMPSWAQIKTDVTNGWKNIVWPGIQNLFKVAFGVDMPSWSDITSSIQAGWNSVMNSIGGMFNVALNFGTGTLGGSNFGGGSANESSGAGRSFASGLDRVPNDGYIARLHKDEAVLNSRDAAMWRSGEFAEIKALLTEMAGYMRTGQVIKLDSGVMAGQLAPAIDARLGSISRHKGRGN